MRNTKYLSLSLLFSFIGVTCCFASTQPRQTNTKVSPSVTSIDSSAVQYSASVSQTPDWENQHVLQINREPARAVFFPYTVRPGDCQLSLNGAWKFRWTKTPDTRIKDFFRTDYDCSSWKDFPVPANWEVNGFGTPIYISAGYPFRIDPPCVTSTPPHNWTTYEERNPTGQYRRTFVLPQTWTLSTHQVYVRFDGVMSAFYVWINGHRVGYSQDSFSPAEFNITR